LPTFGRSEPTSYGIEPSRPAPSSPATAPPFALPATLEPPDTATTRSGSGIETAKFREYGLPNERWRNFTVDHLVPIELGGEPFGVVDGRWDLRNVWPQPKVEARHKDAVEDALHAAVCYGRCYPGVHLTVVAAQRATRMIGPGRPSASPSRDDRERIAPGSCGDSLSVAAGIATGSARGSRTLEVMCGRFRLTPSPAKIAEKLGATYDEAGFQPHYNVAPTQPILAAINDDERTVSALRWGLVPKSARHRPHTPSTSPPSLRAYVRSTRQAAVARRGAA